VLFFVTLYTIMQWRHLHGWDVTSTEAERIQSSLACHISRISNRPPRPMPTTIAGAVIANHTATVAVVQALSWQITEAHSIKLPDAETKKLEYRRGLMAFTYGPFLLRAFEKLRSPVDLAMFRAHGIAHPRRCGMAAHLGLLLGVPSIGCAKKLLLGTHNCPPVVRGEWTSVKDGKETIAACLMTRSGANPIFVSPGFDLSLQEAIQTTLLCTEDHPFPIPLRQAKLVAQGG